MRKIFSLMMAVLFGVATFATTYTAAGVPAALFGTEWDPTNTANDLIDNQTTGHNYILNFENVTLPAGEVKFKICEDHAWATAYPESDYIATIAEPGVYVIAISFDSESEEVGFRASKTADADVLPTIALHGNFTGTWTDTEMFAVAGDKATASLKLNLAAGNYEFGVRVNGTWTSNGSAFTRENNSYAIVSGSGNLTLAADVAGEYELVWTYATNTLAITFPEKGEGPGEGGDEELSGVIYNWSTDAESQVGTTIYGLTGVGVDNVKINKNTNTVPGIKFGNSYVYADGKYAAIKPVKGGFKAGDKLSIALCYNNSGVKDVQAVVYAADGKTLLFTSEKGINGRLDEADPAVEKYTLEADQDSLLIGRLGGSAMYITLLSVSRGGEEPVTVYFYNNLGWESVNAFVWPAEGSAYKEWPGEAAKKEAEQINGKDVYAYTFAASFVNIVFNNGTAQTADLKWDAEKPYFVPGEKNAEGKYTGTWYAKAEIPTGGEEPEQPSENVTVYFYNNLGWADVNAFVWPAEGSAYKEWPGEAAKKEAEQINGKDVYAYTLATSYVNIIFNTNGAQTADLKWDADKPYFVPSGEKNAEGKYTGTWYAKAEIPADEPAEDPFVGFDAREKALGDQIAAGLAKNLVNVTFVETTEGKYSVNLVEGGVEGSFSFGGVVFAYKNSSAGSTAWKTYGTYIQANGKDREVRIPLKAGEKANVVLSEACDGVLVNGESMNLVAGDNIFTATADGLVLKSASTKPKIQAVLPVQSPETPKYYAKNNWEGASEWSWKEMAYDADFEKYVLENVVFGGTGVNINTAESDEGQAWYPIEKIEAFDAAYESATLGALDTIVLMYTPNDNTLAALILGKYVEPVTPPTPGTKYYAKNNWEGASEWSWKEMAYDADFEKYVLENVVFGGTGVNINTAESDEGQAWYPIEKIEAFDAAYESATLGALDTIVLMYTPNDNTLAALILGKYVEPVDPNPAKYYIAGTMTDWKEHMVEMKAVEKDTFEVSIALEANKLYEFQVVRVQGTDTAWYGAGQEATMHYGNSTDWSLFGNVNVTLQTTKAADYKFIFVANEAKNISVVIPAPDPEAPKYYAKNNWDGVTDWTWKEMTMKSDDDYQLECVFGGTGVNINTTESDEGADWYASADIMAVDAYTGDFVALNALDTIVLMYTPSEKMLAAYVLGKYVEPVDPNPAKYYIAGTMTEWAKNMVEMAAGEDNSYSVDIALEADSLYLFKVVRVQGTDTAWYGAGQEATMQYGNSTDWSLFGDANVGLQTTKAADYKFIFVANEAKNISVVIPAPDPEAPKYYAKNNWDGVTDWTWKEMTMKSDDDYQLECVFGGTGVNINTTESDEGADWYASADIMAVDAYTGDFVTLNALDTIVLMYTPSEKMLAAYVLGKYVEPVDPNPAKYYIAGTMTEWAKNMVEMAAGEDNSYSVDIALEADSLYMFKVVRVQGTDTAWYGAGMDATMHYGNSTDWSLYGDVDVKLQTTKAADYKFIFVANEAKNISVVIPAPDPVVEYKYGLLVDGEFVPATKNTEYVGDGEEWIVTTDLVAGNKFQNYESTTPAAWLVPLDPNEGNYTNFDVEDGYYVVKESGNYTFYIKLIYENDNMWVVKNSGTGLFDTAVEGKAVKTISNGMLIIEKAGVRYNVMGHIIR